MAEEPEYSYPDEARWSMKGWVQFTNVSVRIKNLQKIANSMQSKPLLWNAYLEKEDINTGEPPIEVTPFQKLLLVKMFREEKTLF